jgi:arylsulfatase A-like enzyme
MADRPNVLFIMSDDHAAHAISAYTDAGLGPELVRTPQLDRLGETGGGVRADNCFCTNAICTPSRASVLTGQHTHTCDVRTLADSLDPGHEPQMQKLFGAAGYRTAIFGKWHLGAGERAEGYNADPSGFDEWAVLPGQGVYHDPNFFVGDQTGRRGELRTEGYCTDITADLALNFLARWDADQRPHGQPFFCCLHQKAPHRNWEPGPLEQELFAGQTMPEPATLWDDYATRPAAAAARMRIDQDLNLKDVKQWPPQGMDDRERKLWFYDRYIKDYLRCCAGVDRTTGLVLDRLGQMGQLDNTIIVYTSDQGFFLGDHGWFDKRFIYEHSLRMPLLMRGPGIEPGVVDGLLTNVDFAPTLLDLCGLPPHAKMQGRSFASMLRGEGEPDDWQDAVYYRYWMDKDDTHRTSAHYGVRTRTHKLAYYYCDPLDAKAAGFANNGVEPHWELFDLQADPDELRNVYGESGTETLTTMLKARLRALQDQFADQPVDEVAA